MRQARIAPSLITGDPDDAGLDPEQLNLIIDRARNEWVDGEKSRALVICAARDGVVCLNEAFGHRTSEGDDPVTTDTMFLTASISKVVTAAAVMMLAERGRLGITRFVKDYLPELKAKGCENLLIRHLLTHTSGYTEEKCMEARNRHAENGFAELELPALEPTENPIAQRQLHVQNLDELDFPPGSEMVYCNYNYLLLGEIIRRVSGVSYKEFIENEILKPLRMTNSRMGVTEEEMSRVALRGNQGFEMMDDEFGRAPLPMLGLRSTTWDLAVFTQMFLNKGVYGECRLLSPASVEAMTTNQIPGVGFNLDRWHPEASWGYGWGIQGPERFAYFDGGLKSPGSFSHSGMANCYIWGDPKRKLVGVYLSVCLPPDTDARPNPFNILRRYWHADIYQDMLSAACI